MKQAPASQASERVTAEEAVELFRRMVQIRRFEEAVQDLFRRGEIHGSTHLCIGQEAVSAGIGAALEKGDRVAATYRGHGHALALGCDPEKLLGEMLGKETGVCGGRAGSMNVVDIEHGLIGCFAIVGGALAAATGVGLALRDTGNIAVGFLGDGAVNQGYFLECLNFAKVMELPIVYICENNLYSEYTPLEAVTPGGILPRVRALEIAASSVDGQDALAVRAAAMDARREVLSRGGPMFLEARTYRYVDHGRGDPVKYREESEIEEWQARDPLHLLSLRLQEEFALGTSEVHAVTNMATSEIERVTELALAAAYPDPTTPITEYAP